MSIDARSILDARARALAEGGQAEVEVSTSLVLFWRGRRLYGVRAEDIAASGRLRTLSPAPGAPPWLAGALLHRGAVLSVMDLPRFWGLELEGAVDMRTYLVLAAGERRIGVLVEDLLGLREVKDLPVPYEGQSLSGMAQVTQHWGESVFVISAALLLQDPRLRG